eukprot:COSAG02_NODE_176_length_31159_cov_30.469833_15_plen_89_part_00
MSAAAARQADQAQKDEEAEECLKRAVLAEAKKQAKKVDVVTADVLRAKSGSEVAEQVRAPPFDSLCLSVEVLLRCRSKPWWWYILAAA